MQTEELLKDLTDAQKQAVTCVDGPLLVVAAAGSGKTRVITRRVAYLIGLGIPASSIVAITFTNKAAGEMKSRIAELLDRRLHDFGRLEQPWPMICTFHSLCLRILRHYATQAGLGLNFSIYDSPDQEKLIKEAIAQAEISVTNFPVGVVQSAISDAKNKLLTPRAFADRAKDFYARKIAAAYERYQKLLAQNNAVDFDDLLMKTALLFREHPEVLAQLQERFAYILIDEYQDTNHAQYMIAHLLAQSHQNICVVGDPDQSIYAWRGADIQNILDFETDYPKATVVRLEQNYRSTKTVLKIASQLIANNRRRKDKALWTENDEGEKATVYFCGDEHDEARTITRQFKQLREQGRAWSQMAVFYRVNSLSRVMEDALRTSGVPYRIARGVAFYQRKEIKDVLAYLRVIANPADEVSLTRVVNTPARGIGDTTVKQLQVQAAGRGQTLWMALESAGDGSQGGKRGKSIAEFVTLVHRWNAMAAAPRAEGSDAGGVKALMEDVVKRSGLEALYNKSGDPEHEAMANVNELITSAAQYDAENPEGSLADYLAQVSLVSDVDALKDNGGAVTLMTLHAAKGLEFPVVAIIGLEENLLPHARVRDHPEQLEEERRLCFVGITRAEEILILSRAMRRTMRGISDPTAGSRFLAELPQESLNVIKQAIDYDSFDEDEDEDGEEYSFGRKGGGQSFGRGPGTPRKTAAAFRKGQMVRHPMFGIGRIVEMNDTYTQPRVIVEFPRAGRKTLVLEFARLEPVG